MKFWKEDINPITMRKPESLIPSHDDYNYGEILLPKHISDKVDHAVRVKYRYQFKYLWE